jgi:hypothetical protein
VSLIGQCEPAGLTQHVRMALERQSRLEASPLHHPGEPSRVGAHCRITSNWPFPRTYRSNMLLTPKLVMLGTFLELGGLRATIRHGATIRSAAVLQILVRFVLSTRCTDVCTGAARATCKTRRQREQRRKNPKGWVIKATRRQRPDIARFSSSWGTLPVPVNCR